MSWAFSDRQLRATNSILPPEKRVTNEWTKCFCAAIVQVTKEIIWTINLSLCRKIATIARLQGSKFRSRSHNDRDLYGLSIPYYNNFDSIAYVFVPDEFI